MTLEFRESLWTMKIENGLLGFVREETGHKPENTNTVLDNYPGIPMLNIFHALVSHFKNKNLKMHQEGRSKGDQSYRRDIQKIN